VRHRIQLAGRGDQHRQLVRAEIDGDDALRRLGMGGHGRLRHEREDKKGRANRVVEADHAYVRSRRSRLRSASRCGSDRESGMGCGPSRFRRGLFEFRLQRRPAFAERDPQAAIGGDRRGRIAEDLFVVLVEKVLDAPEHLEIVVELV